MKNYISIDPPVAQALLKKQVGDEVVVKTKVANFTWKIHEIENEK